MEFKKWLNENPTLETRVFAGPPWARIPVNISNYRNTIKAMFHDPKAHEEAKNLRMGIVKYIATKLAISKEHVNKILRDEVGRNELPTIQYVDPSVLDKLTARRY
jgi:hypothetical protein